MTTMWGGWLRSGQRCRRIDWRWRGSGFRFCFVGILHDGTITVPLAGLLSLGEAPFPRPLRAALDPLCLEIWILHDEGDGLAVLWAGDEGLAQRAGFAVAQRALRSIGAPHRGVAVPVCAKRLHVPILVLPSHDAMLCPSHLTGPVHLILAKLTTRIAVTRLNQ